MLFQPDNPTQYRIVGIDPGTNTLGVAAVDVDLVTKEIVLLDARTFDANSLLYAYGNTVQWHGERVARLLAHEDTLYGYFRYLGPHSIISESPYMGRFPQAFAALTECLTAIRRAVMRYDTFKPLLLVDPPTAKLAVGVKGKGSTKDDVKNGVLSLRDLLNPDNIDIRNLDEHSIDAIAVAISRARFVLDHFEMPKF